MKRSGIKAKITPAKWKRQGHVRAAVFARDGGCVLAGVAVRCGGGLTFHHRRKAGAAGAYTVQNGAALCAIHNTWVEDNPKLVRDWHPDLVVRPGDDEWLELSARAARKSCPTCEGTRFDVDGGPCDACPTVSV